MVALAQGGTDDCLRVCTLDSQAGANLITTACDEIPLFVGGRGKGYRIARLAGEDAQHQFVRRRGHR